MRFGNATLPRLTAEEAQRLQKALEVVAQAAEKSSSPDAEKSKPHPGEYLSGLLFPDGTVKCADPKGQKIFTYLAAHLPPDISLPAQGTEVVISVRDARSHEAAKKFLETQVIPYFQLNDEVEQEDGKKLHVHQTVAWPFFQQLLQGDASQIPEKNRDLVAQVAQLPLYRIHTPGNPLLETGLNESFAPLKTRLAAVELARLQYFDRVDLKEVVTSLIKGALVGGVGEAVIHHTMPHGGTVAGFLRSGLLILVDLIDNVYGEMGVLTSDMEANGLKLNNENVFGETSWLKILRSGFKMKGPGGIFAQRAVAAALKGAMTGSVLSFPAGMTMSDEKSPTWERALVASQATVGTAMGIPFNVRATFPQVTETVRHLIKEGKMKVPDDIAQAGKPAIEKYIRTVAEQDMMSRLGFSASMKAFSMVPGSGLILALEKIGVPRELCQTVFMTLSPAMENILRLMLTMFRLKFQGARDMARAENILINNADKPLGKQDADAIANLFADPWSKGISRFLCHAWVGAAVVGLLLVGLYASVAKKFMNREAQEVALREATIRRDQLPRGTFKRLSFEDFVAGKGGESAFRTYFKGYATQQAP